jgi:hypothetical protein
MFFLADLHTDILTIFCFHANQLGFTRDHMHLTPYYRQLEGNMFGWMGRWIKAKCFAGNFTSMKIHKYFEITYILHDILQVLP